MMKKLKCAGLMLPVVLGMFSMGTGLYNEMKNPPPKPPAIVKRVESLDSYLRRYDALNKNLNDTNDEFEQELREAQLIGMEPKVAMWRYERETLTTLPRYDYAKTLSAHQAAKDEAEHRIKWPYYLGVLGFFASAGLILRDKKKNPQEYARIGL
jgi:hypothetical protein